MGYEALANVAVIGLMLLLGAGLTYTLSGLDRWLDRRRDRQYDHFDVWGDR